MTRKTPLEQMRELADDGLEPWQIAAALGVREAAVAIALQTPTQGGAAGVVERIAGQSPLAAAADDAERDRQAAAAVVPATFAAAADESDPVEVTPVVAAVLAGAPAFLAVEAAASVALDRDPEYGTHVVPESWAEPGEPLPPVPDAAYPADAVVLDEPVIEDDAAAAEVEFDADDGSTYPCANGGDCGCVGTGLLSCPGRDEDARRRAADRADQVAAAVRAVVYPNPIDEPDEIVPIWLCEQGQHEACNGYACPCCASGQCPAVLPTGPQPCEVCGLNVTAQKIAETGRARHPWHPED